MFTFSRIGVELRPVPAAGRAGLRAPLGSVSYPDSGQMGCGSFREPGSDFFVQVLV